MLQPELLVLALAGSTFLANGVAAEEIRLTDLQTEQEFFDAMPVTGTVSTFFGDFEMEHSVPTEEATARIFELIDHQRAAQLYLWGLPIVAHEQLIQGYFDTSCQTSTASRTLTSTSSSRRTRSGGGGAILPRRIAHNAPAQRPAHPKIANTRNDLRRLL